LMQSFDAVLQSPIYMTGCFLCQTQPVYVGILADSVIECRQRASLEQRKRQDTPGT